MKRALLLALALFGCDPVATAETIGCGYGLNATYQVPATAACWRLKVAGRCVMTTRPDVDACNVPERSDELFAGGDDVAVWCELLETGDAVVRGEPADCFGQLP